MAFRTIEVDGKKVHLPKINSSFVGDDWYRRCPMPGCHKVLTVVQLGENHNRCPVCGTLILG